MTRATHEHPVSKGMCCVKKCHNCWLDDKSMKLGTMILGHIMNIARGGDI